MRKVAREKVKTGYAEVGDANGATAPAASEPAPAAPEAPSSSGIFAWTDTALREVAPIRGSNVVTPREPDSKTAYTKIAKAMTALGALLDRGQERPGAHEARMIRARAAFADGKVPGALDLETQADAYALIGGKVTWGDTSRADDFIRYWAAVEGGAFALRALALVSATGVEIDSEHLALTPDEAEKVPWFRDPSDGWRALRAVAVRAGEAEHAELRNEAEALARGSAPGLRALLAAAFERPEWSAGDLAIPSPQNHRSPPWLWPLLVSAPSMDAARALLARAGQPGAWEVANAIRAIRYDLVARYGASATAFLVESISAQVGKSVAEVVRDLAEALAVLVTDDVAAFFIQQLAVRELRPVAASYLTAHPAVSVVPLAQAATGKGAAAEAAKTLLKIVVSSAKSEELLAAKAALSPAAREIFVQLEAQNRVAEEASEDEVPRVLRPSPPVARPAKAAKTAHVLELTPLPFDEPLEWAPGIALLDFAIRSAEGDPAAAARALVRARSARVAPLMAHAFMNLKRARPDAVAWLLAFPEAAAVGLIPPALGPSGAPREAAGRALRFLAARGHGAILEAVAKRYGAGAEQGLRAVLDVDPFLVFLAKAPKMPAFWEPRAFARPLLAGRTKALPLAAVEKLGAMLAFTAQGDPYPGLLEVAEACDAKSLAAFAWDLFHAWLLGGAPSKEQWAFHALGLLGDDESARKLTPLIRAWPGEAAHARAVVGLDVLARIGTDVALMHLHGIAQKLKFKGLQEKAREKIQQVAGDRGLTGDELADRLVPDLGLDERGSLRLDFGPRGFRVRFDEMLKPHVVDDGGNRLPDLPKPKQSDDMEKAKAAVETWKALKKDAKTIASGQIVRLELSMCAERRWSAEVFRAFFVEHPLLIHVVRRLVWGLYDADGALRQAFRVAEDNTFTDVNEREFALAGDAQVGIVHRLELDTGLATSWGQIFADYEILQPFAQLSRETAAPTEAEKSSTKLERVAGITVPTGRVLGLDARGWRRGPPQDAGVVCWYEKPLGGGLIACLDLEPGIYTGMISESPEQKLGVVTLARGEPSWSNDDTAPLAELSPIGFSELLRDLESLLG
ncbi:DUF4132 domain-containing protein [Pendulispora albinea]|uniref:DUF4132 domain-containing protein n=1 Tax=Pendulispora albinea TaxID=2741071 RepID=A0ABZ2M3D8_9BACT